MLAAAAVAAQDKPDFSGNWILAGPTESGSNTAQTMTVRETFTRASIRGTPVEPPLITIAVDRQFASGERSDLYTVGVVGGTTAGVVGDVGGAGAGDQPSHTRFSTTWDGDRLVIETSAWAADAGSHSDHKEVWWLDAEGSSSLPLRTRKEPIVRRPVSYIEFDPSASENSPTHQLTNSPISLECASGSSLGGTVSGAGFDPQRALAAGPARGSVSAPHGSHRSAEIQTCRCRCLR